MAVVFSNSQINKVQFSFLLKKESRTFTLLHLDQEHCMTTGRALVKRGASYSAISTGWQEVLLEVREASDGLLCEAWNQDVPSTVFSDC